MVKKLKSGRESSPKWTLIKGAEKVPLGQGDSFRIKGLRIAVFHLDNGWRAVSDQCPHRGAPLGDGPLEGCVVTCTWHGWEFDLNRGVHVADDDITLAVYPVKFENGKIYVQIPSEKGGEGKQNGE